MPLIQFSKPGFSLQEWIVEHGSEQVRKPLNAVIAALQADGVSRFGATGYCFEGQTPKPSAVAKMKKRNENSFTLISC